MADDLVPPADPEEAIAELRARIAELEAENRTLRSGQEAQTGELTGLRAQLQQLLNPPAPKGKRFEGFFQVDDVDD